jgi:hypothetical protein
MTSKINYRPLNVALRPQSKALYAYASRAGVSGDAIAGSFRPRRDLDLTFRGGKTITNLVFVNRYLGGRAAWDDVDRTNIDSALQALMTDPGLQKIIAQYFSTPISTTMLPSEFVDLALGTRFFKDQAEALVKKEVKVGALGDADAASTVLCLMLPRGVVLVDGNSDGSEEVEVPHARGVLVDNDQADSMHGLGGFHGSVHIGGQIFYYAIGVYSEGNNGIVAFDKPWKNVVATFYHELSEARTDPDVEDVIRTGNEQLLGWYSQKGGEIGDIPMSLAGSDLSLVMQEVKLEDGHTEPVQLQWSNRVHGPEGPTTSD